MFCMVDDGDVVMVESCSKKQVALAMFVIGIYHYTNREQLSEVSKLISLYQSVEYAPLSFTSLRFV